MRKLLFFFFFKWIFFARRVFVFVFYQNWISNASGTFSFNFKQMITFSQNQFCLFVRQFEGRILLMRRRLRKMKTEDEKKNRKQIDDWRQCDAKTLFNM